RGREAGRRAPGWGWAARSCGGVCIRAGIRCSLQRIRGSGSLPCSGRRCRVRGPSGGLPSGVVGCRGRGHVSGAAGFGPAAAAGVAQCLSVGSAASEAPLPPTAGAGDEWFVVAAVGGSASAAAALPGEFLLGQAAPQAVAFGVLDRVVEALAADGAGDADRLGSGFPCRALVSGVPVGTEPQDGGFAAAGRVVVPGRVHVGGGLGGVRHAAPSRYTRITAPGAGRACGAEPTWTCACRRYSTARASSRHTPALVRASSVERASLAGSGAPAGRGGAVSLSRWALRPVR